MGKKKGYNLPETDPVQNDGTNEGTITFTKQDYDAILDPKNGPTPEKQETHSAETVPGQENSEGSNQIYPNLTGIIQIIIPEDPIHTNIDQQQYELIEEKAQNIKQENLMASNPIETKDSATTDSLADKDDSKINLQIAADNVPVSLTNDETQQLDDIKKEQEKVPSENAISPANDTSSKVDEKYTSIELGEIKDPPKKSPTSGFINKVRNIPRNQLLKWIAGIAVVLIIIIIIIVVTQKTKTDDDDDDDKIAARKPHFIPSPDEHYYGRDSDITEETTEEIVGSETHPSEEESPTPTTNLHSSNESTTTGTEGRTNPTWSTSTLLIPTVSDSSEYD